VTHHQPKLHFDRFEFKYLLTKPLREEFESSLRYFMDFDPFVEHAERHRYFVRSLYFDDPEYRCFYDKVDGIKKRSKFRIRTYTETPNDSVVQFLEIKGRYNQFVYKRRVLIPPLNGNDICHQLLSLGQTSQVSQQFIFEYFRKNLRPVALIDYWRRPYISKYDPDFRLTFDNQLQVTDSRSLVPKLSDRRRRFVAGFTIMEVKFKRQIPAWFHRLIQSFELHRISISKICKGMEALHLAEDI